MASPGSTERERVARYFSDHARDFDSIYERDKGLLRRLRDRLSRGTVVRRLSFVLDLAALRRPDTILDVGCGAGRFAIPLAKAGARVIGLDLASEMISLAKARAKAEGLGDGCVFLREDFLSWDPPERFDLALAVGVFDYVRDPDPVLAKMVAAGGEVVASFPRRWHPLVPLRKARLSLAGCPVYFYGRGDVELLASRHLRSFRISLLGRDFMLVGTAD